MVAVMPPILLQKFWRNRNGNFLAVFALVLVPLLLAVEFSVDYASAVRVKNELQAVVDAMALASVKELPDEKAAMLAAQNAYTSGLAGIASGVISSKMSMAFADEPSMSSKATINGRIGGMSGFVFDIALDFEVHAKAEIPPALLEISVTADLSDSMNNGGKITALRASLDEFITTVFAAENPSLAVRLAIVPFSGSVNLPSYAKAWAKAGKSEGHGEHGEEGATASVADATQESQPAGTAPVCATTRGGVLDMTVMTPKEKLFDSKPLNGLSCPTGFTILPLMDGASSGKSLARSLQAVGGGTSNHIAAAWAYRTLSPKWADTWETGVPASQRASKIVVMMTDGENAKGGIHDAGADKLMLDACANMRGDGIEIFAVALQTPASVRPLFVQCTGSEQKVFSPRNSSELRAAFAAVAQKALENRIIQMVE